MNRYLVAIIVVSCLLIRGVVRAEEFREFGPSDSAKIQKRLSQLKLPKIPKEETEFLKALGDWLVSVTDLKRTVSVNQPYNPDSINIYVVDSSLTPATDCHQGEANTFTSISVIFVDRKLLEFSIPDYAFREGFFKWDEWRGSNLFQEQTLLFSFVMLHEFGHLAQNSPNLQQQNQGVKHPGLSFESPEDIEEKADEFAFNSLRKIYNSTTSEKLTHLRQLNEPMAVANRPGTQDLQLILNQKATNSAFVREFFIMSGFGTEALYDANGDRSALSSDFAHPPLVSRFSRLLAKFSPAEIATLDLIGPIDFDSVFRPPKGHCLIEISAPDQIASTCWAKDGLYFLLADGRLGRFSATEIDHLFQKSGEQHQQATNFVRYRLPAKAYQLLPPDSRDEHLVILTQDGRVLQIPRAKTFGRVHDITDTFGSATNAVWRDFFQAEDGSNISAAWLKQNGKESYNEGQFTIYIFQSSKLVAKIHSEYLFQELQEHFDNERIWFSLAGLYSDTLYLAIETDRKDIVEGIVELQLPEGRIREGHPTSGTNEAASELAGTPRSNVLIRKNGTNTVLVVLEDKIEGSHMGLRMNFFSTDGKHLPPLDYMPPLQHEWATHFQTQWDTSTPHALSSAQMVRFSDLNTIWICFPNCGLFRADLEKRSVEFCTMGLGELRHLTFGPNGAVAHAIGNCVYVYK